MDKGLVALLYMLTTLDWGMTYVGVEAKIMREANPIMEFALKNYGWGGILGAKYFAATMLVTTLFAYEKYDKKRKWNKERFSNVCLGVSSGFYGLCTLQYINVLLQATSK